MNENITLKVHVAETRRLFNSTLSRLLYEIDYDVVVEVTDAIINGTASGDSQTARG